MKIPRIRILAASVLLLLTGSAQALQPEVLYGFQPWISPSGLVQGRDGDLYGATYRGGSGGCSNVFGSGCGTVFRVTTNGLLTTLHAFTGLDGTHPNAGLVLDRDGHFYGTTENGGSSDFGTVFQMTTNGVLATLVSFTGTDGANPSARLVMGNDGSFYGTTSHGGNDGYGTVFQVTTNGKLTSLASFNSTNGMDPHELVFGNDGNLYGTTSDCADGSCIGSGTVFQVTTNGQLTTLISFDATTNGLRYPSAGLVLGRDGNFYGTTWGADKGGGSVFKVTSNGVLTPLVWLRGANSLVLGRDGNFYVTVWDGGEGACCGGVFQVTTNGMLTTMVSFAGTNGAQPLSGLVLGTDGYFYGTTSEGGPGGGGTIFRLLTLPKFTRVVRQPEGTMLLTGTGLPNNDYRLWASTDLALPFVAWSLLTNSSFDSDGNLSYADASASTNFSRFYRLSVP